MTSGEIKLVQFALWTLDCLEESEDWSAATLDSIAQDARDRGLAEHDPNGMFRVTDCGPIFKDDVTLGRYRESFPPPKVGS